MIECFGLVFFVSICSGCYVIYLNFTKDSSDNFVIDAIISIDSHVLEKT